MSRTSSALAILFFRLIVSGSLNTAAYRNVSLTVNPDR
jgi:hypothetical protein